MRKSQAGHGDVILLAPRGWHMKSALDGRRKGSEQACFDVSLTEPRARATGWISFLDAAPLIFFFRLTFTTIAFTREISALKKRSKRRVSASMGISNISYRIPPCHADTRRTPS